MKFAAIKANMGIWRYYVTTLTYGDIASCVSPITDEISNSDEAWLDVTGSSSLKGDGRRISEEISRRVKKELGMHRVPTPCIR